jgi:acetylornithine deacetylase/succinyl-diaminopimelate desuccinylase-like protein
MNIMRVWPLFFAALPLLAQLPPQQQLAREILKQLIEINTTDSVGDNTKAAEAMAARFREAGYPDADIRVLAPVARKGNVVVRLRGTGGQNGPRPVLFIGHLDVVEAKREDWSVDPFTLLEKDGYFYGRGTLDMKGDDATLVATFLRLKRAGFRPPRDLILALTADEENGPSNGIQFLVKDHRDLIDAEFCINPDSGGGDIKNGKHLFMTMEAAEKVYASFKLEVTNAGGHSSRPSKDNAIYHLAEGLSRLAQFDFPVHLFDVTRSQLERSAPFYEGQLGADMKTIGADPNNAAALARFTAQPQYNALLRTTCVPTLLSGGHAENALPQVATATVNCRVLPVDNVAAVERTLNQVLADAQIKVAPVKAATTTPYTPIDPKVLSVVAAATTKHWPGLPVVPKLMLGASDGIYLIHAGIPTYGVSGIFSDEDDNRAHGRDERILTKSFDEAVDFMYDVVTGLAGK